MHIFDELIKVYSEDVIKEKINKNIFNDLKYARSIPSLDSIAKKFDLSKTDYNLEKFLDDYRKYRKFKEQKSLYNILSDGITITELMEQYSAPSLYKHIRNGFDFNSNAYIGKKEVLKYFEFDIDLSKFKYKIYRRHTELYGEKEDLEKFKEQYKINQPILMEKEMNTWHLAFDGMMNDWIREIYVK